MWYTYEYIYIFIKWNIIHWSGLPFPSPVHESEKWKVKSESEVPQSCPTLSGPMDCSLPGSSVLEIFHARVLEWGAIAFSNNGILLSHKNESLPFATTWFDLESITLSEISQKKERQIQYDITYMKSKKIKWLYATTWKQTYRYRKQTSGYQWGDGKGRGMERVWD